MTQIIIKIFTSRVEFTATPASSRIGLIIGGSFVVFCAEARARPAADEALDFAGAGVESSVGMSITRVTATAIIKITATTTTMTMVLLCRAQHPCSLFGVLPFISGVPEVGCDWSNEVFENQLKVNVFWKYLSTVRCHYNFFFLWIRSHSEVGYIPAGNRREMERFGISTYASISSVGRKSNPAST